MKRAVLFGSIIAAVLATTAVLAVGRRTTTPPIPDKSYQYRCMDRNQSLYFLVHEVNGKLVDGLMYVENNQVANMSVEQAGADFIKAKVNGDTADVAFLLGKKGTVMVTNY